MNMRCLIGLVLVLGIGVLSLGWNLREVDGSETEGTGGDEFVTYTEGLGEVDGESERRIRVVPKPSDSTFEAEAQAAAIAQLQMNKLKVTIVPHRRGKESQIILYRPQSHFHVVLSNAGAKDLGVWREWCSWGYYSLTFEIKNAQGEVKTLKKGMRAWTKNYPDATRIPAGENEVIDVYLQDKDVWVDTPFTKANNVDHKSGGKVQIRAVYSIEQDEMTTEHNVWTGTVKSDWYDVLVYY